MQAAPGAATSSGTDYGSLLSGFAARFPGERQRWHRLVECMLCVLWSQRSPHHMPALLQAAPQ